jgi:hypothetical protein
MFNLDYQNGLFPGFYYPQELPPLIHSPTFPPPVQAAPVGYLQQAPPDPPLRPVVALDQEHLTIRLEGFLMGAILIFGLFFRRELLLGFGVVAAILAVYFYFDWSGNVARFQQAEELRMNERLLPPQAPQQHYVPRPLLF